MGFLLLGAFLFAAPAVFADYSLFAEWRQENGAVYAEGSEVITLLSIGKNGELGLTDGSIWWDNYGNDAWTVESNYGDPYSFRITFNVNDLAQYYDIGFALTGSLGRAQTIPGTYATGLQANMSVWIENSIFGYGDSGGTWCLLGQFLSVLPIIVVMDLEHQSYLDNAKTSSTSVNVTNDAMQTYLYGDVIDAILGQDGGFGVRFENALRNGSSISIVAVKRPSEVPEPATLAAVGLGLAGVGLARRRRR